MPVPPLVIVVGIQKSGTTLLNRLLLGTGLFLPIGSGEADAFWGNEPPFSPVGEPVGRLRIERGDDFGHQLDAEQATPEVIEMMHQRLAEVAEVSPRPAIAFLTKSPYHAVRLPWIRSVFPQARVVCMVRRPEANIFSLTKKHVPHTGRGLPPDDDGWWGVKPAGWRRLLDPDPVRQCLNQWIATNERILATLDPLDVVIDYATLCHRPQATMKHLTLNAGGDPSRLDGIPTGIEPRDEEFLTGSTLRSKNRLFRATGTFETPSEETIEHPPLAESQREEILTATRKVWSRARELATTVITATEGEDRT